MRTTTGAAAVLLALLASASPASADKPARGCPDSFERYTFAQIQEEFTNATQEQFDSFDKNRDGIVCGKQLPSISNVVDNTANRP
jgi:Ca2+-binding EF-hand superfamily protein